MGLQTEAVTSSTSSLGPASIEEGVVEAEVREADQSGVDVEEPSQSADNSGDTEQTKESSFILKKNI
jgi:hypothetical protein